MKQSIKLVFIYFAYQLFFTLITTAINIGYGFAKGTINLDNPQTTTEGPLASTLIGVSMLLAGLAMVWHLVHFNYVKFNLQTWKQVPLRTLCLSVPFLVSALFIANILNEMLELPNLLENQFMSLSRNVFGILSVAVMAPIVEELLFRGAIQGHLLRQGTSPRNAILLSALIFGIIHFNPAQIAFAFLLGLVFGWLYWYTGSVIPGIVGHFLNNTVAVIMMALSTPEEMQQTTMQQWGEGPTYLLLGLAWIVFVGMFLYLRRHLPAPTDHSSVTSNEEVL